MHLLMLASENDGIQDGKVGGIGDVIRDIPRALADQGHIVHVLTPSYGFLHDINKGVDMGAVHFDFYGQYHEARVYEVQGRIEHPRIHHIVIDHPMFGAGYSQWRYSFYCNDPPDRPFATDATKFALFCKAAARSVVNGVFGPLDCIHLHDWHMAFWLILRAFHPDLRDLKNIRTVFSIHNLALQGIRPFRGSDSSLEAWYPHLRYDRAVLVDPRWQECVNPVASAIRLADAVHTVSPAYAEEILHVGQPPLRYGGEGIEADMQRANQDHRLFGILNGCPYPKDRKPAQMPWPKLMDLLCQTAIQWCGRMKTLPVCHFMAVERLHKLARLSPGPDMLLTTVGRVVEQKMYLMRHPGSMGTSALEQILRHMEGHGVYIVLGTGDLEYEDFLTHMSSRYSHFVFLNGFSEDAAQALYANGNLFVMPSSFEPCGISQMLAMRDGQPCLVHNVGGLKDTVRDGVNGFVFSGTTITGQVDDFVRKARDAIELKRNDADSWGRISKQASECRFLWEDSVNQYIRLLYQKA